MRRVRPLSEEELHVVPGAAKEGPYQFLPVAFCSPFLHTKGEEKVNVAQKPKKDPESRCTSLRCSG